MRFQRAVAEFAAAITGVVFVAGCSSSSPEPKPLPEPTLSSAASPSPSPSPSITAPTLPPEAEGSSAKAAKAFARYYFDVVDYAAQSGDTQSLRELGAEDCQTCSSIVGGIEQIYAEGGRITAEDWQLRSVRVLTASRSKVVLALAAFLMPEVIVDADGERKDNKGGRQPMTMHLDVTGSTPVVARLDLVK